MARRQIVEEEPKKTAAERTQDLFPATPPPAGRRRLAEEPTGSQDPADAGYKVVHTTESGAKNYPLKIPGGCLAAKGDEPACNSCGARLSVDGQGRVWHPCGHPAAHEPPMMKGWVKETLPTVGTEPGHGKSPRMNVGGEVLYCEVCHLAQFKNDANEWSCTKGHDRAAGLTAAELRSDGVEPGPRQDTPVPGGGSRWTAPEPQNGGTPRNKETPLTSQPQQLSTGWPWAGGNVASAIAAQTVTAVWGKELYSPKQFHTYEVGPFTVTTIVLPGETASQALERANDDLRRFAEKERERKRAEYFRNAGISER